MSLFFLRVSREFLLKPSLILVADLDFVTKKKHHKALKTVAAKSTWLLNDPNAEKPDGQKEKKRRRINSEDLESDDLEAEAEVDEDDTLIGVYVNLVTLCVSKCYTDKAGPSNFTEEEDISMFDQDQDHRMLSNMYYRTIF